MLTSHEFFKPSVRGSSTRKEEYEQLEWIAFREDACRGTMNAGYSTYYVRRIYIRIYFPDHQVHVNFFTSTAFISRSTAFQFGRDDPYEYALEKCVAYGFTNRGAYQLERFAVLVRFDFEMVALKRFPTVPLCMHIATYC